jgi:CubicO group peptidase (beta-lactamase class C family)
MSPHIFNFVLSLSAVLLMAAPAHAQTRPGIDEIDKIFGWAGPTTPGCVVAVSQHGKPVVSRAYGSADLERDVPLTPDAIFDAGSVVKQFVAAAVLLLVEEGRLSLTEDVRKVIPELPDYGHRITVDHLLTHTSGIRDWDGMAPLSYANADAWTMTLRQRGLNFAPGEEWAYSNGGYVLLKEMVARVSGMKFSEFARTRLFDRLGMSKTAYVDDVRQVLKQRALAYQKVGDRWRLDVLLDNDRGGGGALFTTAGDLLTWNDALTNARLGAFVSEKIQEPATLKNGRKLGYARGLYLDTNRGGRVVWHTGGAGGYGALAIRFPDQSLSAAIMCNAGEIAEETMFARRIFDLFVPATVGAAAGSDLSTPAQTDTAASVDLNGKAGLFFSERSHQPLRLVVQKGQLRIAGGPPLLPVKADVFRNPRGVLNFMSQDEFELHFTSGDQVELKSKEGAITPYRRAQPYTPTVADLKAFTGRYESAEIRGVFEMAPAKEGLMVRLNDSPAPGFEFKPVDRDTFQLAMVILRFRRDQAGNVVALEYSNPVVRNITFTRQSERPGGQY